MREKLKLQAEMVASKKLTVDELTVIMLADLIARQDAYIDELESELGEQQAEGGRSYKRMFESMSRAKKLQAALESIRDNGFDSDYARKVLDEVGGEED